MSLLLLFNNSFIAVLTCDPASLVLRGKDAALRSDRRLVALPGSYIITGNDVVLAAMRQMLIETGSLTLTGKDTGLTRQYTLSPVYGSIILTGKDVSLIKDSVLPCEAGEYILTGQKAPYKLRVISFDLKGTFPMESNAYEFQGQTVQARFVADEQTFALEV